MEISVENSKLILGLKELREGPLYNCFLGFPGGRF